MRTRWLVPITSLLVIATLSQSPAIASPPPLGNGGASDIKATAWITDLHQGKSWIQGYGKVRVKNVSRHRATLTCTITLLQDRSVIGSDSVDLSVPGGRTGTKGWGIEGGNEGGKVTVDYRCRT